MTKSQSTPSPAPETSTPWLKSLSSHGPAPSGSPRESPPAIELPVPIAILGIVGDLIESIIKRRANIKDSGGAIPGMGGFFDMSDSLILVAPVGFILFRLP